MQQNKYNQPNTDAKSIDGVILSGVCVVAHSHLELIRRRTILAGCQ